MPAPGIPLADVFAAANSLRSAGFIVDYALGGALAAVRYTEPFTTYDADFSEAVTMGSSPVGSAILNCICSWEARGRKFPFLTQGSAELAATQTGVAGNETTGLFGAKF